MAMTKEDAFTLWTARKWNEYADEDASGTREARTPIDVLFATHKAALLAASPNVDAIVEGVVAKLSPTTGSLTTDQIRSAAKEGVSDFFSPLVNTQEDPA